MISLRHETNERYGVVRIEAKATWHDMAPHSTRKANFENTLPFPKYT